MPSFIKAFLVYLVDDGRIFLKRREGLSTIKGRLYSSRGRHLFKCKNTIVAKYSNINHLKQRKALIFLGLFLYIILFLITKLKYELL